MRKVLIWTGAFLGLLIVGAIVTGLILNEPLPEGKEGPEADALARKMLSAIDMEAWDTTGVVQWNFSGMHEFLWDKERNFVEVKWDGMDVILHTKTLTGKAWKNEVELKESEKEAALQKAWAFFCNDSFWLNAPAKVFDPGTKRSLVTMKDGTEALLLTYTSGGVTPGDSYLWILDENGLPQKWKMWVNIIPIGGVPTTWENWVTLPTGAKLASSHKISSITLNIDDIKGARHLSDLVQEDPFSALVNEQ